MQSEYAKQKARHDKAARAQMAVNQRMRDSNVRRDIAAGMRKRQEEQEAAARGTLSNAQADPFIRRETRPKILWNSGRRQKQQGQEQAGKQGEGGGEEGAAAADGRQGDGGAGLTGSGVEDVTDAAPSWVVKDDLSLLEVSYNRLSASMQASIAESLTGTNAAGYLWCVGVLSQLVFQLSRAV